MRTAPYRAGVAWVARDLADTIRYTWHSPRVLWLCIRCRLTPGGIERVCYGWRHASSY